MPASYLSPPHFPHKEKSLMLCLSCPSACQWTAALKSSFWPLFRTLQLKHFLCKKWEEIVGFQYQYLKHHMGHSPIVLLGQ